MITIYSIYCQKTTICCDRLISKTNANIDPKNVFQKLYPTSLFDFNN